MKFRTELHPIPLQKKINLSNKIVAMGSCFSENIGQKLLENKFETLINPFGVIFNPLSVIQLLEWIMEDKNGKVLMDNLEKFYIQHDEVWYNYHLHSKIASQDKEELKQIIKEKAKQTFDFLEKADTIILTFGTAFIYELIEKNGNNKIPISNCHKQNKNLFDKKLIDLEAAKMKFENFIKKINSFGNKEKQIIITVSPVRHLKEGLVENSVSKSILRVLAHSICQNTTEKIENIVYFPSYELVLDDLRDYRFYETDLLHPNSQAIDYIWQKFSDNYFDMNTQLFLKKWQKIVSSLAHKPFFPNRESHQNFIQKLILDVEKVAKEFKIDTKEEIEFLKMNDVKL